MAPERLHGGATQTLRRYVLAGLRYLPPHVQARWMSTLFLLYEVLVLGVIYDFAHEAAAKRGGWRGWLPRRWLVKCYMLAYCWRAHRSGLVIDGALRRVRTADGEPVDLTQLRVLLQKRRRPGGAHVFPAWMLREMQALAAIEPQLAPTPDQLGQYYIYSTAGDPTPGRIYAKLWSQIGAAGADVVVLCPWLKRGGADKGTLQFLAHYRSRFSRVLCIMTLDAPSPWLNRVPAGVTVLEVGADLARLEPADRRVVVTRLLLQLRPRLVHVIQSEIGWEVVAAHGRALRSLGIVLFASLFADEIDADGTLIGYPMRYAAVCRPVLDRVLCDNASFCKTLMRRDGYTAATVLPVYFWQDDVPSIPGGAHPPLSKTTGRFLWAARYCPSKRPELLLEIAKAAAEIGFEVWGEIDRLSRRDATRLRRLSNVRMHGSYDSFASIVARERFDGFLYTSISDGMPNVLLEAAAAGLPIVAPAGVGGIGDLVSEATGYPVDAADSPHAYVAAMRRILAAPTEAAARAAAALDLLAARHSQAAFDTTMRAILDDVLVNPGPVTGATDVLEDRDVKLNSV